MEDLGFFKAVVMLLPAPFEGRSPLHLERRGPVKGGPASFKGSLNVFRRSPQVSISWKVKQKSQQEVEKVENGEKSGVPGVLQSESALIKHLRWAEGTADPRI